MIEVLHFGLGTNRGGIETYLEKIWSHIDRTQFHFSFIDMTGEDHLPCFYEEFQATGCNFYKITPRNVSIRKNREEVHRLFSKHHFDIFHFSVNTLSYIFPVQEALKAGVKVIIHSRSAYASSKKTRIMHNVNQLRIGNAPVTRIAISQAAGEWLFKNKEFVVYHNGVDCERFAFKAENRDRIRMTAGCGNRSVIGHVGTFLPVKNHRFMVDVFEAFLYTNPNTELWFVGDGPLRPQIEELVKERSLQDNVLFWGIRSDLPDLYAGMDMLWFPSVFEGLGNVVLEAECEGLPCLLSDGVPKDTMLQKNVFSLSLDAPIDSWVKELEKTVAAQAPDRAACYQRIIQKGWSTEQETSRLEELYRDILRDS